MAGMAGMAGVAGVAGTGLLARQAPRTPIRGRGRGAAGSRAASARLYGQRRRSSSPAEVLEALCAAHGWGIPVYQLHCTEGAEKQYIFKVVLPGLANSLTGTGSYIPTKLSRTVQEAENQAAEYVLMSLGTPYDATTGSIAGVPGYLPAAGLPVQVGLNYLGQPITTTGLPLTNGVAGADMTSLYSMPGFNPAAISQQTILSPPPQQGLMIPDSNGNFQQFQPNAGEITMAMAGMTGVSVVNPPPVSTVDPFPQY